MMNSKQPKPKKTAPEQSEKQPIIKQDAITKKAAKKPLTAKNTNTSEVEIATDIPGNEIQPSAKKRKTVKKKVIRDSFSFPEHDYLKISELKQTCLAEGIHVKKGELLRAGLQLLSKLSLAELKQAVAQVEKVKTGRPNASKK